MTSLLRSSRQVSTDGGFYIPLSSLVESIYSYDSNTHSFGTAAWTQTNQSTLIDLTGGYNLLKDLGKTVVSSGHTFRKIQVVSRQDGAGSSTFGVGGSVNTNADYLTGYIELGFEGNGTPAPVAHYGC